MTYLERVREALKSIDHKSKGDRYSQTRERDSLQLELQASIADELKRIADALILQSGREVTAGDIVMSLDGAEIARVVGKHLSEGEQE